MAKGQGKWEVRKLRSLFDDWTNRRADKIIERADRILARGKDEQFLRLMQIVASLQPQQVDANVKGNVKIAWPGAKNDNG
jgi:hypothetical protein